VKKAVANETAEKEIVQVAFTSAQVEHEDLERTVVATCQELEWEGGSSGSSVDSRLRSLGGRVAERLRSTFRHGVQRTFAVASTHYDMNLEQVVTRCVVVSGIEGMTRWLLWSRPPPPSRASPPPCPSGSRATSSQMLKTTPLRVRMKEKETCRSLGP
jgi:hypothetical protein